MTGVDGCRVHTFALDGTATVEVEVELQYTGGLMQRIILSGLPGGALREARDRIRGCLDHYGLDPPRKSVLANFAPADLHKEGNGFDLPLAVGLLTLTGVVPAAALARRAVVGELALDGRLRPVRGGLMLALAARRAGRDAILLPRDNGPEAALVDGLLVEAVETLAEAIEVLQGGSPRPVSAPPTARPAVADLADVRGQASGRRALEVAAAGRHNLLLRGPPGTGKTMLAQRLAGLLPPLGEAQSLQVTALHGLLAGGPTRVLRHPPFRAPHHTISRAGLIGGGVPLRPGEVGLAHEGVLFLDELPEFPRSLLESLRQPMEDHVVHLARAGRTASFPARFQLIAAMNPCPCGYRGHPRRGCTCTAHQVEGYARRLSGPLLDRFDLAVEVPPPESGDWLAAPDGEGTAPVARRVAAAAGRLAGRRRPRDELPREPALRRRLDAAIGSFHLSGRAVRKLLSVSRTIAALAGRDEARPDDLDEALSFRVGLLA